jgi:hypothetical protein
VTLFVAVFPAQCWGAGGVVTRATSTVAAAVTAAKPTMSGATQAVAVSVKAPELPATPLTAPAPIVSTKAPSAPAVSVQVTAPAVSVKAGSSGVSVKAPTASVSAAVPAVSVSATTPAVSVKATAPAVSVKATTPAATVKASTPAASVNTAHAPSGALTTSAPGVSVKTSGTPRPGAGVTVPAVAVQGASTTARNATSPSPGGASSRRVIANGATAGFGHDGPAASASGAALSDGAPAPLDGPVATSFGQQTSSGYANPGGGGASPSRRLGEAASRRRLGERETRAIIEGLAGCLATLPPRERLLLELLSGVDVPHALTPDQVAATLHIRGAKLTRLERKALARLRTLGRTTACAGTAQSAPAMDLASYTVVAVPGSAEAASGGVKAARYAKAPSGGGASSERQTGHFGLGIIPASHADALLLLIAILAATLAILALSVDAVGAGPRNRRWRARWLAGTRQAWRRRRRR